MWDENWLKDCLQSPVSIVSVSNCIVIQNTLTRDMATSSTWLSPMWLPDLATIMLATKDAC